MIVIPQKELTVLHGAAEKGHIDLVELLVLNYGCDVQCKDRVSYICDIVTISIAIQSKMTPLHYAVMNNHVEVFKFLVNNGADINSVDTVSQ